jgi:YggT family protein
MFRRFGAPNCRNPFSLRPQAAIRQPGYRMERAMNPFLWLITTIIDLYIWILTRNPIVHSIGDFLYRVTEPALRPIRNIMPNLGGIDVSPVILIIGLLFLKQLVFWLYIQIFI